MAYTIISILSLALAAIVPAAFWFKGRRMFGSGTHPAALFLLAWMAVAVLMVYSKWTGPYACGGSSVWVALNFIAFYLAQQFRNSGVDSLDKENDEDASE